MITRIGVYGNGCIAYISRKSYFEWLNLLKVYVSDNIIKYFIKNIWYLLIYVLYLWRKKHLIRRPSYADAITNY